MEKTKVWFTKKDAMRHLSASKRTIENWVKEGIIKSYKLGGRVFFDRDELDDTIRSSRNGR